MKTSVVLTIHNKEFLMNQVVNNLVNNLSELNDQIVIVFDGCTDNSEGIVRDILKSVNNKKIDYLYADNVFETKANNIGLKSVLNDYVVLIQDDMVVTEKDFDKRMLVPFKKYGDVGVQESYKEGNLYDLRRKTQIQDPEDPFKPEPGARAIHNKDAYEFAIAVRQNRAEQEYYDNHMADRMRRR